MSEPTTATAPEVLQQLKGTLVGLRLLIDAVGVDPDETVFKIQKVGAECGRAELVRISLAQLLANADAVVARAEAAR